MKSQFISSATEESNANKILNILQEDLLQDVHEFDNEKQIS